MGRGRLGGTHRGRDRRQPADGAATWFPCNDHPGDKAHYRIAVTTDSPYQVVANGGWCRAGWASRTTWVFDQAAPMATYLATVQIGRYDVVDLAASPVPTRAVLPAAQVRDFKVDFGRQQDMMKLFAGCSGRIRSAATRSW